MLKKSDVGRMVSCVIDNTKVEGKIQRERSRFFICQNDKDGVRCSNKLGYEYAWSVESGSDKDLKDNGVKNLKFLSKAKKQKPITHIVIWDEEDVDPVEYFISLETANQKIKELSEQVGVSNILLGEFKSIKRVEVIQTQKIKLIKY